MFGERVTIAPGDAVSVAIPRVTVPTTASLAALAMIRLPPAGRARISPYAFAGPAYLVTDSDLGGNWGLRAGGGVRVPLSSRLSLFGEYRYTRVAADAVAGRVGGRRDDVRASSGDIRVDLTVRNHSAVGGLGFTF